MTARRGVGLQCKHTHVNIYLCLEPEPPPGLPAGPGARGLLCCYDLVTESKAKGGGGVSSRSPAINVSFGLSEPSSFPGPLLSPGDTPGTDWLRGPFQQWHGGLKQNSLAQSSAWQLARPGFESQRYHFLTVGKSLASL